MVEIVILTQDLTPSLPLLPASCKLKPSYNSAVTNQPGCKSCNTSNTAPAPACHSTGGKERDNDTGI